MTTRDAPRFPIDRIVDIAAGKLGIDPVEIRRRNAIDRYPYTTAMGVYWALWMP